MTHVFIVDDITLKIHLEYMFAGTTGDRPVFFEDINYKNPKKKDDGLVSQAELKNISMIADVLRIKEGDKIIFYKERGIGGEGTFYGVFKAKGVAFYDAYNGGKNYLSDKLHCDLNYRVMIEPLKVYKYGVSEYDAIDSLKGVNHPYEMCWSMLYRKLSAGRGCTMLTDYESKVLIEKISKVENNVELSGQNFSFDAINNEIIVSQNKSNTYDIANISNFGDKIEQRAYYKFENRNKFEAYLQAYIVSNSRKGILDKVFNINGASKDFWIGNEVICSFGERRIDILTIDIVDSNAIVSIFELKAVNAYDDIIKYQLPKYRNWVDDYIKPIYQKDNLNVIVKPYIVSYLINDANAEANFIKKASAAGMGYIDYYFDAKTHKLVFANKLTI